MEPTQLISDFQSMVKEVKKILNSETSLGIETATYHEPLFKFYIARAEEIGIDSFHETKTLEEMKEFVEGILKKYGAEAKQKKLRELLNQKKELDRQIDECVPL